MNEIVCKFLLAADEIIPEMHLRQLEFTYSACKPFTKKQIKNTKNTKRNRRFTIYLSRYGNLTEKAFSVVFSDIFM